VITLNEELMMAIAVR